MTAEAHLAAALQALGFQGDPEMARTPELLAGWLREFLPGPLPALEALATTSEDLVVLRRVPFHALCAHHLLPFFGEATVAWRPSGRICGLGAVARLVEALARQPQLEERLAAQIADALVRDLSPSAVGVRLEARQLCLELRGARVPAICEVTALRGAPDAALLAALQVRG